MPFKSQAQRRKFAQLLVEGKTSPQTFEKWNRESCLESLRGQPESPLYRHPGFRDR